MVMEFADRRIALRLTHLHVNMRRGTFGRLLLSSISRP
jgi:hypothetical protein